MTVKSLTQASRRRTFAIISHPDAGKTTLTEHLLLAGGAIRAAGAVRARGENRRTRSDWMKIERERGISVSASVMTFEHKNLMFNLLDTPGHEDFSEDTYRTLTAADAAVMVLDAAKGIEPQTLKLFEVCRLRDIPIITFINKMDREAEDALALLDEVASKLQLDPSPLYWPAGSGGRFKGMAELASQTFLPYAKKVPGAEVDEGHPDAVSMPEAEARGYLDPAEMAELNDAVELIEGGFKPFDRAAFVEGHMTPVLFGSALRHFGVDQLLAAIGEYAPAPKHLAAVKNGAEALVNPDDPEVTGFVFKVQANMDRFAGLPNFAPEILQRVRVKDPLKAKHLKKALESLAEEGVTQLFRPSIGSDFIVGAVGQLQFEVMADRLANEYGLECLFEASPFAEARWVTGEAAKIEDFAGKYRSAMGTDIDEDPVFLGKSAWEIGYVTERFPDVKFSRTKERG